MERKIKLIPYKVYKYCPKCSGTMEYCNFVTISSGTSIAGLTTGSTFTGGSSHHTATFSSQSFNHKCVKCGHGETYEKHYPYIDYIEDGELG